MPEMFPAKLTVPVSEGNHFEFTVHNFEPIADFVAKVQSNCGSRMKSFSIDPIIAADELKPMTMGELKRNLFKININGKVY